jgi:hypothetical protein
MTRRNLTLVEKKFRSKNRIKSEPTPHAESFGVWEY